MVWSVDEKTGIQAKSRVNPTRPAVPGKAVRQEFEYRRNGTATLFAALDVHQGGVAGWVTDSSRSENFVAFLSDLVGQTPASLDLHCICDNLSAHKTPLSASSWPTTPGCICTSRPPMPAGSTKSSCSSQSWSDACCAEASSTLSATSPSGSLPSSTTTTGGRSHSAGPTTVDRSWQPEPHHCNLCAGALVPG